MRCVTFSKPDVTLAVLPGSSFSLYSLLKINPAINKHHDRFCGGGWGVGGGRAPRWSMLRVWFVARFVIGRETTECFATFHATERRQNRAENYIRVSFGCGGWDGWAGRSNVGWSIVIWGHMAKFR